MSEITPDQARKLLPKARAASKRALERYEAGEISDKQLHQTLEWEEDLGIIGSRNQGVIEHMAHMTKRSNPSPQAMQRKSKSWLRTYNKWHTSNRTGTSKYRRKVNKWSRSVLGHRILPPLHRASWGRTHGNPSARRTAKIEHALHRASKANHWYSGSKPRRRFRKWVKAKNRFKSRVDSPRTRRAKSRRNPKGRFTDKTAKALLRALKQQKHAPRSLRTLKLVRKWTRARYGRKTHRPSPHTLRSRRNPAYSSAALPYARKGWDAFDRPGSSWRIADCPYHTGWQREAWQSGAWDRRNNKPRP